MSELLLQKLTLAIPIYNEGRYLRAAIESCIGQAGKIILCDNASDDGSSDICEEYASKYHEVEHIRRDINIGAFNNFKEPIFTCDTEYFCWIGGHDKIEKDYTLHLLRRLDRDSNIGLAAGTIQHFDEEGRFLNKPVRSTFLACKNESTPLDRVEALTWNLRDLFIFHGIYRTDILRKAWRDRPCLGFDRILVFQVAALAKTAHVPEALIYARDFPASRKSKEDRERRSGMIAGSAIISKSNFERNHNLSLIVMNLAHDDISLSQAYRIIEKIRSRHHERRRYRNIYMKYAVCCILLMILITLLAIK
jgi:glycosyltransferase involved in cell wall biosynthesis